jgi:thymidylate synthase
LSDIDVKIWEPNTTREFLDKVGLEKYDVGDMGPMYGFQLRNFNAPYHGPDSDYIGKGVDQVAYCLNLLKTDPYNRRILMTTFNPAQVTEGVLYPCHGISILFNVGPNHELSCMMTQRSVDTACGLPFNIVSYALLVHLFCQVINNDLNYLGPKFTPGKLIMNLGDTHIYKDHYSDIIRQVLREPHKFPQLKFNRQVTNLTDFKFTDMELVEYQSYPIIGFKMVA